MKENYRITIRPEENNDSLFQYSREKWNISFNDDRIITDSDYLNKLVCAGFKGYHPLSSKILKK